MKTLLVFLLLISTLTAVSLRSEFCDSFLANYGSIDYGFGGGLDSDKAFVVIGDKYWKFTIDINVPMIEMVSDQSVQTKGFGSGIKTAFSLGGDIIVLLDADNRIHWKTFTDGILGKDWSHTPRTLPLTDDKRLISFVIDRNTTYKIIGLMDKSTQRNSFFDIENNNPKYDNEWNPFSNLTIDNNSEIIAIFGPYYAYYYAYPDINQTNQTYELQDENNPVPYYSILTVDQDKKIHSQFYSAQTISRNSEILIDCTTLTSEPMGGQESVGKPFYSPNKYSPNTISPNNYPPNTISPNNYPPNTISPNNYPPNTISPNNYPPNTISPITYPPNTISPNIISPNTISPNTISPITYPPNTISPNTISPITYPSDTYSPNTVGQQFYSPDTSSPDTYTPETTTQFRFVVSDPLTGTTLPSKPITGQESWLDWNWNWNSKPLYLPENTTQFVVSDPEEDNSSTSFHEQFISASLVSDNMTIPAPIGTSSSTKLTAIIIPTITMFILVVAISMLIYRRIKTIVNTYVVN